MADCIFCRIAAKEIPAAAVYEDDAVIAFKDLEPQAPVHVLIIPKKHIGSLLGLTEEDKALVAHIHVDVVTCGKRLSRRREYGSRRRADRRTSAFSSPRWTRDAMAAWLMVDTETGNHV